MRIHRNKCQIVLKFFGKTEPKWCKITSGQNIFGHRGDFGRFGRSWEGPSGGLGRSFAPLGRPWGALWCRLDPQDHANLALSSLQRIMLERRPTKLGFGSLLALIFRRICVVLGGQNACKSVSRTCENRRSDTVPKRLNFH